VILVLILLIKLYTMQYGPYEPTWIKVDPRSTSLGSSKLKYDMILKELKWDRSTFSFSFSHNFVNIYPWSYVDLRSRLDQRLVHTNRYLTFRSGWNLAFFYLSLLFDWFAGNILTTLRDSVGIFIVFCRKKLSVKHNNKSLFYCLCKIV